MFIEGVGRMSLSRQTTTESKMGLRDAEFSIELC